MKQSTTTYTKREKARRAGVAAGIPSERVTITVHKNGEHVRFGWKESAKRQKVSKAPKVEQRERNGVKRPKACGVCAAVWAWLDAHPDATLKDAKAQGEKRGVPSFRLPHAGCVRVASLCFAWVAMGSAPYG